MRQCQCCDFQSRGSSMRENRTGYLCRSEIQCFNRVIANLNASTSRERRMRHVGIQMANVCFNLSHSGCLRKAEEELLRSLSGQWDAAVENTHPSEATR